MTDQFNIYATLTPLEQEFEEYFTDNNLSYWHKDIRSSFICAARDNNIEAVKFIYSKMPDKTLVDETYSKTQCWFGVFRTTALFQAIYNNHIDMIKLLLSFGCTIENTNASIASNAILYLPIISNNIDVLKLLLDNRPDLINLPNEQETFTLLHTAANYNRPKMIELLMNYRCSFLNTECTENKFNNHAIGTPLDIAIILDHRASTISLLANDAKHNDINTEKLTSMKITEDEILKTRIRQLY